MRYFQHIIIVALLMQLLVSCWARTRFIPDPWPISSSYWNEIDDLENNDNSNNDNDFLERAAPFMNKPKKSFHTALHFGNEDRRKKYLREGTHFRGGQSLQGLWAMPGRR